METSTRSQSPDAPSLDTTFALLQDPRRRHLVSILTDREPPVSLRALAAAVAARERDADPDEVPSGITDSVAAELHHAHLPKLADGGLVVYDPETKTVTDSHVEAAAPFSELGDDFDD